MKIKICLLLFLLLIFSCSSKNESSSFYGKLKQLEFSRSSNLSEWRSLVQQAKSEEEKLNTIMAMAHTKNDSLFPILNEILQNAESDSLIILTAFGLAQINHPQSESVLLKILQSNSLTNETKQKIVPFLVHCSTKDSWHFLSTLTTDPSLKETAFKVLGVLNRKFRYRQLFALLDSTKSVLSSAESYYLYNTPLTTNHLPNLLKLIKTSPTESKIFLLKAINKILATQKANFNLDSLSVSNLTSVLNKIVVPKNKNWRVVLAGIPLISFSNDSNLVSKLPKFFDYPNPHVRLASYKTLLKIKGKEATPILVDQFGKLPETYEKALLAKYIAQKDPSTAYLLINNSLDKGNVYFKSGLLEALGDTKLKLSKRLLREFLKLDDPVLSSSAFMALAKSGSIYRKDIDQMLNSRHVSNVGTVLDWLLKRRKKISDAQILSLFKRFNKPSGLEIQMSLCQYLMKSQQKTTLLGDSLINFIAHPVLIKTFPQIFGNFTQNLELLNYLPDFLHPDSLSFQTSNLNAEITTTKGTFKIRLASDLAPLTVKNFTQLAQKGFYDRLYFHRVVPDFVIQGGDPTGTGWGGPGYLIPSEHSPADFERGSVGIATAGFDTGGCQFFICHSDQPHLNGNYTLFGKVISGMSVVDQIEIGDQILSVKFSDN